MITLNTSIGSSSVGNGGIGTNERTNNNNNNSLLGGTMSTGSIGLMAAANTNR